MLHRGCEVNTHTHTAQITFIHHLQLSERALVSWHGHETKRPLVRGDLKYILPLWGSGGRELGN